MNNDLISIIVPIYNVKEYLEKCVNSILAQKYKNIEILLIDDGSNDGSSELCDKLLKNDKRIKVFHKTNGGLADARNFGIMHSNGNYLCFVDSDDTINEDMINELYNLIINHKCDIATCNFNIIYVDNSAIYSSKTIKNKVKIYNKYKALSEVVNLKSGFGPNVCNKMFKKELFNNDCKFPKGRLFEDLIVTVKAISKSNKIVYTTGKYYNYYQRKRSITKTVNDKELDHIAMSNLTLNYILEMYPNLKDKYVVYHCINYLSVVNKLISNSEMLNKVLLNATKYIKKNLVVIFFSNTISFKKKCQFLIFTFNFFFYKKIYVHFYKN